MLQGTADANEDNSSAGQAPPGRGWVAAGKPDAAPAGNRVPALASGFTSFSSSGSAGISVRSPINGIEGVWMGGFGETVARDDCFSGRVVVGETTGFADMRPGDIGGFEDMRSACLIIHHKSREETARSGKKGYLRPVLRQKDFDAHPAIVRYALDEEILDAAERYLGTRPALRSLQLYWTAANESVVGSQMFHFDHIGSRQLKLFVYMNDVGDAEGPFSFFPADVSARVRTHAAAKGGRYADEEIFAVCSPSDLVVLRGAAGAGGLVDTTRCLHFGGRARGGERLMAIIQYVRPVDDFDQDGMMRPTCVDSAMLSPRQKAALARGAVSA